MDELKLPAVLTIEGRQHKLAQTIVENTKAKNQKVLTLNSMQSVTEEEIKKGITYLAVMEQNLNVFKEALQAK
jgi:zinc transport system substrate-binding protein